MGPWTDFLLLALALSAGWLGWVLLTLAGRRPFGRKAPRLPARVALTRRVVNSQAVDSDR